MSGGLGSPSGAGGETRLRFAPSPTGVLHVGGARTALFNWLLARRSGGRFLLRIEDTDRERSRPEHTRAILDGLEWLGLDWDEEPTFQADGVERHRSDALGLLERGLAYRDFAPPEELARARERAVAAGAGAHTRLSRELAFAVPPDERERRAAAGEPHAVRFRVPEGETRWRDRVHGDVRFANEQIEDLVLLRSDGTPTYNLAVVSDDADLAVSHVVRGDDHLSNTPKQILLYRALGRLEPVFAHLPLILGPDGRRLSKRHGARSVEDFRAEGFLPDAMVNFLALLGWSPGTDEEILSRDELVERFSLDRVVKKGAVFDAAKLEWTNQRHMARADAGEMAERLRRALAREGGDAVELSESRFELLTETLVARCRTLSEMARAARPYVGELSGYDAKAVRKAWGRQPDRTREILAAAAALLRDAAPWGADTLNRELRALAEEMGHGVGPVFQALRVALTGGSASPGIDVVLAILGRRRAVGRIERALKAAPY